MRKLLLSFIAFAIGSSYSIAQCSITGLAASYCEGAPNASLVGTPAGGTFSGPGISGTSFDPSAAGIGTHTITYTTNYSLNQVGTFAPVAPVAPNFITLGDDQVSGPYPVGFNFTFYGNTYSNIYISSNGFITFDANFNSGCCSGGVIPSNDAVNNFIAFDWNDLYPPIGGTVSYETVGTAPNRRLLVTWTNINHCCSGGPLNTGQIILYETSNIIEIHSTLVTSDGSVATQGIEGPAGSAGIAVPGRNSQTWTANNDYVQFIPGCTTTQSVTVTDDVTPPTTAVAFTTGPTNILVPDSNPTGSYSPLTVSGLPTSLTTGDISLVCFTATQTFDADFDIYLLSPVGTVFELSTDNGGASDNYTNTCFSMSAVTPITAGTAPFTGTFIPEGAGGFNSFNGQNPNGIWQLHVIDDLGGDIGSILNFAMVFDMDLPAVTGTCSATVSTTPTATDACAGTITGTTTDPLTYTSAGNYTITWTFDDGGGNTITQTQSVVVTDGIAPVPNSATLADVTAECSVTSLTAPTATDNCAGTITGTTTTTLPITTQGTTVVTWTYNDGNGNVVTQTQNVILQDLVAPVITCPTDITVSNDASTCGAVVTYTAPTATDNCSTSCADAPLTDVLANFLTNGPTITGAIPNPYNFALDGGTTGTNIGDGGLDMYDGGNFLNTNLATSISYTDGVITPSAAFGATGQYFTTKVNNMFVMAADVNNITNFYITGNNGADGSGSVNGFTFTTTSGCLSYDVFVKQVYNAFDPSINQIIIVPSGIGASHTYDLNTNNGDHNVSGLNTATRIYYLLVGGSNGYFYTNTEIQNMVNDFLNQSMVATNGSAPVTCTQTAGLPSGSTFPVGTNVVTYEAMDAAGNVATCSFNVIVTDNEAPVADAATLSDVMAECEVTSLTAPTATDNCGSITGTPDVTLPINTQGTTVVTWTYDDGNGNTTTQTQNVVIMDMIAPTPDAATLADVTAECEVTSLTAPTATDNCAGMVMVSNDAVLPINTQGITVVTWTYEDMNGNISTQTQNVVINDVTAPVADVATLSDVTAECEVTFLASPTATDNCSPVMVSNDATLPIIANTTVTWTYTDDNGNTSTQTQNIVITAVDASVTANGATLTANHSTAGATFQWVDCDNGNAPIPGETGQSFTATQTGNYAVEVTVGSCTEVSPCEFVDLGGINELTSEFIHVYPNPASTVLNVETDRAGSVEFFDVSGKLIYSSNVHAGITQLNVSLLATGTYNVRLTTAYGVSNVRVVINRQ